MTPAAPAPAGAARSVAAVAPARVRPWVLRVALGVALCTQAAHAAEPLGLLDAWRLARRNDPVLSAADAQRRIVEEDLAQQRALLRPQVAATAAFDQQHVAGLDPARTRTRGVGAAINQTVLDIARTERVDAARASADAQSATFAAAEQQLGVRVALAYLDVLAALDQLRIAEAVEAAYRGQADQAAGRHANGLTAQVDVDQARAYHANAQAGTLDARTTLQDRREALAEIIGTPVGALRTLREDLPLAPPDPADPQAWVDRALAGNPTLRAYDRRLDAADRVIAAERAGHLPTLTAGVGIGRATAWPAVVGADTTNGRTATTVGLTLTVPLYSGGAIDARTRQAAAQRDVARDEREAARRRVARDTLAHHRGIVAGIGQVQAARRAVAAADAALASTRVGLELGTQTMTDLLLAIQTLSSAQDTQSAARHRVVASRLLLAQDAGTLGEADLAALDLLLDGAP